MMRMKISRENSLEKNLKEVEIAFHSQPDKKIGKEWH
jgi:hypothetical protein